MPAAEAVQPYRRSRKVPASTPPKRSPEFLLRAEAVPTFERRLLRCSMRDEFSAGKCANGGKQEIRASPQAYK